MGTLTQNLRYALRQLLKSPGFTLTAVLTLALGIGATTAIYTVVYATFIAPMPYPEPKQLVMVWSWIQGGRNGVSAGDFTDWKQQSHVFQDLIANSGTSFNLAGKEAPEMVQGQFGTPGMYRMMGIPFQFGRDFLPEEGVAGKEDVVTISNKLWKHLGADPHILGKSISLDQRPYTVVGVWGPGQPDRLPWQIEAPLVFKPEQINHEFHWLNIMGRLKPGITLAQANEDMSAVAAHIAEANPRSNTGWGAHVEELQNDYLGDNVKQTLWLLLAAVGLLLLIACVNVANLLLAKGTTRQREVAIRTAIGATRRTIFVQFLVESLLLALIGGVAGIGLGFGMLRGIIAAMPDGTLPSEADLRLSLPVLFVTIGATTLAGLLFGCAPAWSASRLDPAEFLKEGGRAGSGRMRQLVRRGLVVGEFTLALALLAGAGMAIHSFWNLTRVDLGIETDHVLVFGLPMAKDGNFTAQQIIAHYQQILSSVESTTGVQYAAALTGMPLYGAGFGMPFTIEGQPESTDRSKRPGAGFQMVTPHYLQTFGIRLVGGRSINEQDTAGSVHVAMVNEEFVSRYFKGQNPLGKRIFVEELIPGATRLGDPKPWEIVGVFHNVHGSPFQVRPEIDVPFAQSSWPNVTIGVRTTQDPAAMTKTITKAVHAIDANAALNRAGTMDQVRDDTLQGQRFNLLLYVIFAVIALALAAVGIYGVMAFSVGQRMHEIGVRMALGASRDRVIRMILGEGAVMAGIGLLLGLAGSYFVGRAMHSTLYGVGTFDFPAWGAVGTVLLLSALVACYVPARRAARVEPVRALRID